METILQAKNILKVYDNGVIANRAVSITIANNTIHAIVGENGAGKTTLMKVIFGIEQAQALSFGIVLHAIVFLPVIISGLISFWLLGAGEGRSSLIEASEGG